MRSKEEIMGEVESKTDTQTSALVEALVDIRDELDEIRMSIEQYISITLGR